jgi:hypothetical protein
VKGATRRVALLLALAWSGTAGIARAQQAPTRDLPRRQANFAWDARQVLRVNVSYRDILDEEAQSKLTSGLPTTIVMRGYVFRESGGDALAATFKTCRVIFDLWDEIYKIEISQTGEAEVVTASPTLEGVLRRCAEADKLATVARSLLTPKVNYYFAAIVEINPVSPGMLEQIKRWVSRPTGTTTLAPGDALFGSFVGLFVTRIGDADRRLQFRTQPFTP